MTTDTAPAPDDFMSMMKALRAGRLDLDECPDPFIEGLESMMKRTRAELRAEYATFRDREARAPKPGTPAPDFRLELLDAKGDRTGEMRRLSDCRGKPVALAFGSYT